MHSTEGIMKYLATLIIQGLFFNTQTPVPQALDPTSDVEYFCEPLIWVDTVHRDPSDDNYKGTIESTCTYKALAGGGTRALEGYLHVKVRDEAATIHSGPTQRKWRGRPSSAYDITVDYGVDKGRFSIRQDVLFTATDNTLWMESKSTKVDPVSSGTLVREMAVDTKVTTTQAAGWYRVRVQGTFGLEKPWYIPGSIFKDQVTSKIQDAAGQTQLKLVTELAGHS